MWVARSILRQLYIYNILYLFLLNPPIQSVLKYISIYVYTYVYIYICIYLKIFNIFQHILDTYHNIYTILKLVYIL